jgi:hypothetical protein
MSYSVRHSYDAEEGPKELDRLADELLRRFDAVTEWEGYAKPKLHPPKHLGRQLKELGPPRVLWCYPWEAFLQMLKRIFEMSNYKSACYQAGVFWAVKSVMNYRDPQRASWHEDVLDPVSDGSWSTVGAQMEGQSALLLALQREPEGVNRVRSLRSVRRMRCRVAVGDWVLLQDLEGCISIIARVRDIMQVEICTQEGTVVRLWVDGCSEPCEGERGELWAPTPGMSKCMLIKYELTYFTPVQRHVHAAHDVYTL